MQLGSKRSILFSSAFKAFANYKIREYGKMLRFNLDTKSKKIHLEIMLEGEKEALKVDIGRYEVNSDATEVKFYEIETSRTWITKMAENYLDGKPFEIPREYAKLLKIVV